MKIERESGSAESGLRRLGRHGDGAHEPAIGAEGDDRQPAPIREHQLSVLWIQGGKIERALTSWGSLQIDSAGWFCDRLQSGPGRRRVGFPNRPIEDLPRSCPRMVDRDAPDLCEPAEAVLPNISDSKSEHSTRRIERHAANLRKRRAIGKPYGSPDALLPDLIPARAEQLNRLSSRPAEARSRIAAVEQSDSILEDLLFQ